MEVHTGLLPDDADLPVARVADHECSTHLLAYIDGHGLPALIMMILVLIPVEGPHLEPNVVV